MPEVKNLYSMLRSRYPANEYALMAEVSDASGFYRSNSADFIAVNLWPSRGLAINGIELKSYRSDWLSELKKPAKAENIFQYCDYFWLLTAGDGIAKLEEIPVTWGWLSIENNKIKLKKDAPKLTPIPLSKHFVCAMLKRAESKTNFIHVDAIQDKITAGTEEAASKRDLENRWKLEKADSLIKTVADFEAASGIKFGRWDYGDPKKVGEAVKFINDGGTEKIKKDLEKLKKTADHICKQIKTALDGL